MKVILIFIIYSAVLAQVLNGHKSNFQCDINFDNITVISQRYQSLDHENITIMTWWNPWIGTYYTYFYHNYELKMIFWLSMLVVALGLLGSFIDYRNHKKFSYYDK